MSEAPDMSLPAKCRLLLPKHLPTPADHQTRLPMVIFGETCCNKPVDPPLALGQQSFVLSQPQIRANTIQAFLAALITLCAEDMSDMRESYFVYSMLANDKTRVQWFDASSHDSGSILACGCSVSPTQFLQIMPSLLPISFQFGTNRTL